MPCVHYQKLVPNLFVLRMIQKPIQCLLAPIWSPKVDKKYSPCRYWKGYKRPIFFRPWCLTSHTREDDPDLCIFTTNANVRHVAIPFLIPPRTVYFPHCNSAAIHIPLRKNLVKHSPLPRFFGKEKRYYSYPLPYCILVYLTRKFRSLSEVGFISTKKRLFFPIKSSLLVLSLLFVSAGPIPG